MKNQFRNARNEHFAQAAADSRRLVYHLMPPAGWLNDPNGLVQHNGLYHIFYQYSPMDARGALKGWGHYTTPDFIHFKEEDAEIYPDKPLDQNGAYSGSAFVDKNNVIHFFYTGNIKYPGNFDYINEGRGHFTNTFTSKDGFEFSYKTTLLSNDDYPAEMSCHVRDPKIYEKGGKYYLVLGARTRDSIGEILLYESSDLQSWKEYGRIHTPAPFGYMWECPDLFDLDGQTILITCPQGVKQDGIQYENIYQNGYFVLEPPLSKENIVHNFHELDHGFDFYAPQTFLDEKGRRILIGWMGMPDAEYTNPTVENFWQHALTLPRKLSYHNNRLYQYPIEETENLRESQTKFELKEKTTMSLPSNTCEIHLDLNQPAFTLVLDEEIELSYKDQIFTLSFKENGYGRTNRHVKVDEISTLDLFMDTSSLEIFINHGQHALTTRIYPEHAPSLYSDILVKGCVYTLSGYDVEYLPLSQNSNK
jgi:beta-fructofuranosidase